MASAPGLYNWVKKRVDSYGVPLENLNTSLNDGMVLCAILHSYHPVSSSSC